jgi:hypothetical protein
MSEDTKAIRAQQWQNMDELVKWAISAADELDRLRAVIADVREAYVHRSPDEWGLMNVHAEPIRQALSRIEGESMTSYTLDAATIADRVAHILAAHEGSDFGTVKSVTANGPRVTLVLSDEGDAEHDERDGVFVIDLREETR